MFNDCIQKLENDRKEIFLMSYLKGMNTKAISEIVKKPKILF